jgi:pilus assembly protein Flp/PilA
MIGRFLRDDAGATAAEYAMLLILFGCVVVLGAVALSSSIGGGMGRFANVLDAPAAANEGGGDTSPSTGGDGASSSSSGGADGCGHGKASDHNPHCSS